MTRFYNNIHNYKDDFFDGPHASVLNEVDSCMQK